MAETNKFRSLITKICQHFGIGMRGKLIVIFIALKIFPLLLTVIIAWMQAHALAKLLRRSTVEITRQANSALTNVGTVAISDSIETLNHLVIDEMERASTDIAARIAAFLYSIDSDVRLLAAQSRTEKGFRNFITYKTRATVKTRQWILAPDKKSWIPNEPLESAPIFASSNAENNTDFHYRPRDVFEYEQPPLFLEVTFVDLDGNEKIKVTSSSLMDAELKNVADRANTFCKAETYFAEAQNLGEGEIYVSDVIGAYVGSHLIGMYNPENCAARGLEFDPTNEAYAAKENPVGKRFRGLVRWVMPVFENGAKVGYITAALNHDHIMEFVDHLSPMDERYVEMTSAFEGNYAFIWDYKCRSIAHPRHHSIVGFNPETGEPEVPWLETSIYQAWQESGESYTNFIRDVPLFDQQSRTKKPAKELTAAGLVGLDGRYLNNAPQCTGWMDLTQDGGSGSFLILWSGIWKPNTAAAIPYYTGKYGDTKHGFGMVTLGAGLDDFQRPAYETKADLDRIIASANHALKTVADGTFETIDDTLYETSAALIFTAFFLTVVVILAAIWIVSSLTRRIYAINDGFTRFRSGERQFRFNEAPNDELSLVTMAFDQMADALANSEREPTVILNIDRNIVYANELWLQTVGVSLAEIVGKPYADYSVYPRDHAYDPIGALEENNEAEVMYLAATDHYIRGHASRLYDSDGNQTGFLVSTQDLTDMLRQQRKLEETITEANVANDHKRQFLARMSHEIRTPLNAIIGTAEIIRKRIAAGKIASKEEAKNDVVTSHVIQIENSSRHLLALLNDILDITKIESGKIEINLTETDLLELGNTIVSIIKPRADERHVKFVTRFDLNENSQSVVCDSLRLRQILINLLGNAIKFTPENGTVTFVIEEKERVDGKVLLHFVVKDTGIGISEKELKNLFKPFQQANKGITQKFGGSGLGLAISRTLVQMFGGDITVRSVENEGSRFSFSIWLEECAPKAEEEINVEELAGKFAGKHALLVDDVDVNRIIASSIFEDTGLEIDEAADGAEAVEKFSQSAPFKYDVIFMDVQMPKMNGYEATEAIRHLDRPDANVVPILALTANAFKEDIDKALASGMTSHLAKPLDSEKVLRMICKLFGISTRKASAADNPPNGESPYSLTPDDHIDQMISDAAEGKIE